MRETYYYIKKILFRFYIDVLRLAFVFWGVGSVIVFAVNSWRFKPIAYIIVVLIGFGMSFWLYMRKRDVINEFKENQ